MLLDCNLEYKKGESQTSLEFSKETDFARVLQLEEEYIKSICDDIIKFKPDLVITEKGISDLAQHYLVKAGISAIRRVRKSDNNRIARACGATIVNRTDEIREDDLGLGCGLFEIRKIGEEYYAFIEQCKNPKACTIILRGASKDVLNEVDRNFQDAMNVARNVLIEPFLIPGGGAGEMEIAKLLEEKAKTVQGINQWPFRALARAFEVIPRTLIQNCGANVIRTLTALRAKHAVDGNQSWGVNGDTGDLVDMKQLGIWEPLAVKQQTYKTAIEVSLRTFF
jgi:T-complex protein 1 subunit gamma